MRGNAVVFDDFRGGVNLPAGPYSLDINQARDLLNVGSNAIGSLRKRNGFSTLAAASKPLTTLFGYNGSTDYLIGVGDDGAATDIYKYTITGTQSSIKGAVTATVGAKWEFIQAPTSTGPQGPLWGLNGVDTPIQWSGSGNVAAWTANTGTLPNGKFILYFDNRVFVAGVSGSGSKLYASGIGDPRDWASPSAVTTTFDPDDGEDITGIGTVGSYILVFKPSKTYVVFDTNSLAYRMISSTAGSVSHRSIAETNAGTFFLSSDQGVMATDGSTVDPIGVNVQPLLDTLTTSNLKNASGVYSNYKYELAIDTAGYNDKIIEYDTKVNSWWIHQLQMTSSTTGGISDWATLGSDVGGTLYGASALTTSPLLFEAFKDNVWEDNGNAYTAEWITQWHVFRMPHIRKILRQIRADALGQFSLSYAQKFTPAYTANDDLVWEVADGGSTTFGGTGNFGGTGVFGDEILVQEHRYYTPGTARAWSFKWLCDSSGPWELYAYTLALDSRKD